jgi:hypothetical protein
MITLSERDTFIAAHVTPRTKEALQIEAEIRHLSVSALIAHILVEKLEDCGHDLSKPVDEVKVVVDLKEIVDIKDIEPSSSADMLVGLKKTELKISGTWEG